MKVHAGGGTPLEEGQAGIWEARRDSSQTGCEAQNAVSAICI
jgi:hypothetical protein